MSEMTNKYVQLARLGHLYISLMHNIPLAQDPFSQGMPKPISPHPVIPVTKEAPLLEAQ